MVTTQNQQDWIAKLLRYQFDSIYKPRKENRVVDALSMMVDVIRGLDSGGLVIGDGAIESIHSKMPSKGHLSPSRESWSRRSCSGQTGSFLGQTDSAAQQPKRSEVAQSKLIQPRRVSSQQCPAQLPRHSRGKLTSQG
ncbi:hypothetical protein CR513_32867, partial [Mucuna pruriens]